MAGGNGHVIDPGGEARRALQAAVAEHGPGALSNPSVMDGISRDRLAGLPGESVLIGSAARSDVPALLRQRVASLGIEEAIQSVAAILAQAHALDRAASVWVVGEFARALGYAVPGISGPGISGPGGTGSGGTGSGGTGPGGTGSGPPKGTAVFTGPAGGPPHGRPRSALGVAAAVALVGIYLGIAAVAHLSPFHGKTVAAISPQPPVPGSSAPPSQSASATATPDVSPDPAPDPDPDPSATSAAQALWNLIPAAIQADGCPVDKPVLGATAVRGCSGVSYGPGLADATVTYYLFASNAALNKAYDSFLTAVNVQRGAGNCGSFTSFSPPCETPIKNTNPVMNGRAVEFTYRGNADLVSSYEQQDVLIYVTARDGHAMLRWWVYPNKWIVTSG